MKIRIDEILMEEKMIISERIFYVMEQKNITQLELSRRTGISTLYYERLPQVKTR